MIKTTKNKLDFVYIEFVEDHAEGIKKGTVLKAQCTHYLTKEKYAVFTFGRQDPFFYIRGTEEEILKQIKFVTKL